MCVPPTALPACQSRLETLASYETNEQQQDAPTLVLRMTTFGDVHGSFVLSHHSLSLVGWLAKNGNSNRISSPIFGAFSKEMLIKAAL